ncbi:MAG TPA: metallophosphoesterase [Candidatus Limnocylindria bacterium]|nr:metallophosphoesterase [Candidatus Limnocylindria bacterium]
MTDRLRLPWPDRAAFVERGNRPIRLLAVSDEVEPALEEAATRRALGRIDLVLGAGDLEPAYLGFLADAFGVPLLYVRGNHDVGAAWADAGQAHVPAVLPDGHIHDEQGLRLLPFSGAPRYAPHGRASAEQQVSGAAMWRRVLRSWPGAAVRRPLLVLTHAAPRGLNDAEDHAHRGFASFRWLLDRLAPPLWIHGHATLLRRGVEARTARRNGTTLVNVTGATLIELEPADDR